MFDFNSNEVAKETKDKIDRIMDLDIKERNRTLFALGIDSSCSDEEIVDQLITQTVSNKYYNLTVSEFIELASDGAADEIICETLERGYLLRMQVAQDLGLDTYENRNVDEELTELYLPDEDE